MQTFRVHFEEGYLDVPAKSPAEARESASIKHPDQKIKKIKVLSS